MGLSDPGRELSFQERYSHVRNLMNIPQPITFLVTYPNTASLPTVQRLQDRIIGLCRIWPHLKATVVEGNTSAPTWQMGDGLGDGEDGVLDITIPDNLVDESAKAKDTQANLLHLELNRFKRGLAPFQPLFQVVRYLPARPEANAFVGITISHIVADGQGSIRLVQAILAETLDPSIAISEPDIPPKMEDTKDMSPPYSTIIPLAFREVIGPRLPTWLREYLIPKVREWPGDGVAGVPTDFEEKCSLLHLSSELLSRIKAAGKVAGVKTLHPIIKAAWAAAVWKVAINGNSDASDLRLTVSSPRSERNKDLGHPYATGNYVSIIYTPFTSASFPSEFDFWTLARAVSNQLSDPAEQLKGLHSIGIMAYIPNSANSPDQPTAWETFFTKQLHSSTPYRGGAEISNLGYTPLPAGAVDMAWIQPNTPVGVALNLTVIGHQGGMRCCSTWREGCVLRQEEVRRIEKEFVTILEKL